jgi:hypothetical protein
VHRFDHGRRPESQSVTETMIPPLAGVSLPRTAASSAQNQGNVCRAYS